jgi:hypothetical protein
MDGSLLAHRSIRIYRKSKQIPMSGSPPTTHRHRLDWSLAQERGSPFQLKNACFWLLGKGIQPRAVTVVPFTRASSELKKIKKPPGFTTDNMSKFKASTLPWAESSYTRYEWIRTKV